MLLKLINMNKNILITGATGDIGKKLNLSLKKLGFNTICI